MIERFQVSGMSCAACQANVTKAVQKLDGVNNVDVSLLGNSMKVDYDENTVDADAIIASVEKIGYGAKRKEEPTSAKTPSSLRLEWNQRQESAKKASQEARKRLWASVILMIPLMYIAMAEMLHWPLPAILSGMENRMINTLVQLLMATIILIIQKHFFVDGFKGLLRKAPNMDSLVALGSSASYLYALAMTFIMAYAMGRGNMELVHMSSHSLYYDSAAMIVTLVSVGKYLESRSKSKTGDALSQLMDLTPKKATILRDGKEQVIASEEIVKDDIVLIKPGQRIPVDGVVIQGVGYVDQSAITGESMPVEKQVGDQVLSATMNENGAFQCRAEKVGDDTTLSQIIRLVDEAGTSKAQIARIADKVAGVFVPVVMGIALFTFVLWMFLSQNFQTALNNAISVLVISCPCALGLATPMAIMVGTEKAARFGILLKNAQSLENLHRIDTIVLDKTGTITSGKPSVQKVQLFSDLSETDFLEMAGSMEQNSQHPLGQAVVNYVKEKGLSLKACDTFENITGRGVRAMIHQKNYLAGNQKFMEESGLTLSSEVKAELDAMASNGQTPLLFSDTNSILGMIGVADTIRTTSQQAIQAFKNKGIHVVMLTGDNQKTALALSKNLAIDEVISEVLPADKESQIRRLQAQGKFVAMIGDGINDAPALVRSDIGIAIGQGTDIAMDSADVVLMKNSLLDVNTAIELSQAVLRNIKQNLFWAFFYNVVGIPLAMGILQPFTGWSMSPMYGAAAMSLSSIFVCSNAWRLRFFEPKKIEKKVQVSKPQVISAQRPTMQVTMHVDGMMCNHCVATVESAIRKVAGVKDVNITLEDGIAKITMDEKTSKVAIRQAVVDAGYIPSEIKKEEKNMSESTVNQVKVADMMCNHCVGHVKEALEKAGMQEVNVDLETKTASFVGDKEKGIAAIQEAGYKPEA